MVEEDTRSFTALGATSTQARVKFEVQSLTAIEALAQLGGLRTDISDPTGVFILRSERARIANSLLARSDLKGAQRMVYVLDLTQPNGIFIAREFMVRDNDTMEQNNRSSDRLSDSNQYRECDRNRQLATSIGTGRASLSNL